MLKYESESFFRKIRKWISKKNSFTLKKGLVISILTAGQITTMDGLPNEIASDDPIIEEDKSPLQSHEFSFSSQGVSLGKFGYSPSQIVFFTLGGSKRIKAPRSYCDDMEVSQSFDNTKRKREHVLQPISFSSSSATLSRLRLMSSIFYFDSVVSSLSLFAGHSGFIQNRPFIYFHHRSSWGGACFFLID
ncbi:hypothetical protein RHMOL_Rhmol03G0111500 [Rhododendron molle]|uniref:Uncharacterized protein n=1 Tax=Rhododendron molle TaxID=49168 RepID=A0ACC0PD78_RHOML|nr:hypothetical protein RHMOL_Rhmol03G0111500 [Rhododendron molle]